MTYTRVNWEDLPSTNTPINATNLNKMDAGIKENDNKLSGIKGIDNTIYANDFKCKNLVNKSIFANAYYDYQGNYNANSNLNALFDFIKVNPNTSYTLSVNSSVHYLAIYEFTSAKVWIKRNQVNNASSLAATTSSTTQYVRVQINKDNSTTMTQSVVDSLTPQFELGEATPYTPYKNFDNTEYVAWTNPTPNATFDAQQITLNEDTSKYEKYEVLYKIYYTGNYIISSGKVPIGQTTLFCNDQYNRARDITAMSGTSMTFGVGRYYATYGNSNATTNNAFIIPIQVILYK